MTTLLILLLLFLVGQLAMALCLWIGAKWARIAGISYWRALAAALLVTSVGIVIHFGSLRLRPEEEPAAGLAVLALELGINLLAEWGIIKLLFRTSLRRAIKTWLVTLVSSGAGIAALYFLIAPYVLQAYFAPTHAMAPTLLGPHRRGVCPHCAQTATVGYDPQGHDFGLGPIGMCDSCQQSGELQSVSARVYPPDRFVVNKMLKPQRWDLVTFRAWRDPSERYVKRLVGFPSEEVVIKEGGIWINGTKQAPPPDIARITFTSMDGPTDWGSPEQPTRLGEDEYFVLGDFAARSADSRIFGPVAGRNIEGVVTMIYWPPERWRIFR